MTHFDVAIVGGGFSGSMVAAHLARTGPPELSLCMFEEAQAGRGAAYGGRHQAFVLNTRARAMSAFPDDPDHFVRWLGARGAPGDFVSRRLYGDYVAEIVRRTFERKNFAIVENRVVELSSNDGAFVLTTASGTRVFARSVVLATGNAPPGDDFLPAEMIRHAGYVGDPWRFDYRRVGGHVLVIGSGLTALDALVALESCGHRGAVYLVSRHGRFPETHTDDDVRLDVVPVLDAGSAQKLLRSFRQQLHEAAARGYGWRCVVDAVRGEAQALWKRLPACERRRFDRHLRGLWERHRHRAPRSVDAVRARYEARGHLFLESGRIARFADGVAHIKRADGSLTRLRPDWIINCTGPARGRQALSDPLHAALVREGFVAADALGFGLSVDVDGAALGWDGRPIGGLWVVGSLARGAYFEATAVPELRLLAQQAARSLLETMEAPAGVQMEAAPA